jgi:hypothetical protein
VPYASRAEVRALDGLADATAYPDAMLDDGLQWAEDLIDHHTGTSWTYKAFTETLDGSGSQVLRLETIFPRTVSSLTVDGVAMDLSGLVLFDEGLLAHRTALFTYTWPGRNVVVVGTAGAESSPPEDIAWACRTLARQYVLDLRSRIPDRALQVVSEFGTAMLAQPGGSPDRPTSLPEVNVVLNRKRHRIRGVH